MLQSIEVNYHESDYGPLILDGLRRRGHDLAARRVIPIRSEDYPTRAVRPRNSRLDLTRARQVFSIAMPSWQEALEAELVALASEQHC